jgi:putative membrane protein
MRIKCVSRPAGTMVGFLLLLSAPTVATAQEMATEGMQAEVLTTMHNVNQFEIKVGKLAESKGTTYKVRAYGDRLLRDHTMADSKVLEFSRLHQIKFIESPEMSQEQQKQMETVRILAALQGPDFDRKFLQLMNEGHKQAIGMLGSVRLQLPPSSPLRRLISKMIPILEQHDTIANQLQLRELARGQQ